MQYFIVYRFVSKRKRQVVVEQYFCVAVFIKVGEYFLWLNFCVKSVCNDFHLRELLEKS